MVDTKTCTVCGKANPWSAKECECGHQFVVPKRYSQVPTNESSQQETRQAQARLKINGKSFTRTEITELLINNGTPRYEVVQLFSRIDSRGWDFLTGLASGVAASVLLLINIKSLKAARVLNDLCTDAIRGSGDTSCYYRLGNQHPDFVAPVLFFLMVGSFFYLIANGWIRDKLSDKAKDILEAKLRQSLKSQTSEKTAT